MKATASGELTCNRDNCDIILSARKAGTMKTGLDKVLSCSPVLWIVFFILITAILHFTG